MKRSTKLLGVLAAALLTMVVTAVAADDDIVRTRLSGYNETPFTINSSASGEFTSRIHEDGTAIDFTLTFRDLSSPPNDAHIHFGRPGISGGIVLYLCTNFTAPVSVPTPQACPTAPATITGTLTAADVLPRSFLGIDAGAAGFAEMLKAIQADAAYVNVHTATFPSGEIRGRLRSRHDHNDR